MTRSAAATVKQVEITRALRAAKAAGVPIKGFEVAPDGTVRIFSTDDCELESLPDTDDLAEFL